MINRTTVTVRPEIVHAGQPSAASLATLKEIGAKVTDQQLAECYAQVEGQRSRFVTDVVRLGVMLLAKKQSLSFGQWRPWVIEMTKSADSALLTAPTVAQEKSLRSCQVYMQVGKHFLADLEQGNFQPEAPDAPITPPACTPLDIALLPTLSDVQQQTVESAITRFVGGRSLDRMLIDFRRAENAANAEAAEEAAAKSHRRTKPLDPLQMDFLREMEQPLSAIDTLFTSRSFIEKTDSKFWSNLADRLQSQATKARALAKEIR